MAHPSEHTHNNLAEDLERMESVVDYDQDQQDAAPDEESFDIF